MRHGRSNGPRTRSIFSFDLLRRAPLLATAGLSGALAAAAPAAAQQDGQPLGQEQGPVPPADGEEAGPPDIVIRGERYGAAAMAPERELGEDEIDAYALNTIKELLGELGPQIDGAGDKPVLLVNGKRIGNPREITGYPPSALQRVEVLPPDAALRYGYPAGQRVLNLVLKRHFGGLGATLVVAAPTAGGRDSEGLTLRRFLINDSKRANISLELKRDAPLYRGSRNLPYLGDPFAPAGNFTGIASGEIDPALSVLAGDIATIAGVPHDATLGPIDLADVAALAGKPNRPEDGRARTLLAGAGSAAFDASVTMPIGTFNITTSLALDLASSRQLSGLAPVTFTLQPDSIWSPFDRAVLLLRSLDGDRPLVTRQRSHNVSLSLSMNGQAAGWNLSLQASAALSASLTRADRAADLSVLQARLDAGDPTFNPFASLPDVPMPRNVSYADNRSLGLRLTADRALLTLPGGSARLNLAGGVDQSRSASRLAWGGPAVRTAIETRQVDGLVGLSLPLTGGPDALPFLGKSVATIALGRVASNGQPARSRVNGSLFWTPATWVQMTASLAREDAAPSVEQRTAPLVETANVRVYDFATGAVADIVQITGGNPSLVRGSRRTFQLNGSLRPVAGRNINLRLAYTRSDAMNGIGSLPSLTPAVEQAFPSRVVRDAEGQLVSVDMRPINIAQDQSAKLSAGFTFGLPFGSISPVSRPVSALAAVRTTPGMAAAVPRPPRRDGMIQISATNNWILSNRTIIRAGLPIFDRLAGDGGGMARETLDVDMTVSFRRLSLALVGRRRSGSVTRVTAGVDGQNDLQFLPMSTVDLRVAWSGRRKARAATASRNRDLRLTLAISNLFDVRQRVRLGGDRPAPGYGRDESDPLGRVLRLSLDRSF